MHEPQFQAHVARYKRQENLDLISAWAPPGARTLLKTDLFEEAFGQDALLDVLARRYRVVIGIDVSRVVAAAARARIPAAACAVSDVSVLPFKEASFDLIVSISTLDHLPPPLLPGALGDLCRALRPGGCLIVTLDSRHNPLHVLSNHIRRWLGRIYAERCYRVEEVRAALRNQPVIVTDSTAIYHVPFPVNFLARQTEKVLGARADAIIRGVIRSCGALAALPTRFATGRYIALRIVRTEERDGGHGPQGPEGSTAHAASVPRREPLGRVWLRLLARLRIYRRLVLMESCLDELGPERPMPDDVEVRRLAREDAEAYAALRPDQGRRECERRLAEGQMCCAAWRGREIVSAVWGAAGRAWIDYLEREIRLKADEVYSYDLFTVPALRRRGITAAMGIRHHRFLREQGYRQVLATLGQLNRSARALQESVGLRPIGEIAYVGVGPWRYYFCRARPDLLRGDRENPQALNRKRKENIEGRAMRRAAGG
jgi:SAM-dependent methyltransferase